MVSVSSPPTASVSSVSGISQFTDSGISSHSVLSVHNQWYQFTDSAISSQPAVSASSQLAVSVSSQPVVSVHRLCYQLTASGISQFTANGISQFTVSGISPFTDSGISSQPAAADEPSMVTGPVICWTNTYDTMLGITSQP